MGISWFWCLGAVLLAFLPTYVKDSLHEDAAGVTRFLLLFAAGVGAGSFLGLVYNRGRIQATYVPPAGLAISGFLFLWIAADAFGGAHKGLLLAVVTSGIGIAGGVYSVPLYAIMQIRSPVDQRGRVISANNIMNAVFMVTGAIGAIGVAAIDPRPATLLAVLAVGNLAAFGLPGPAGPRYGRPRLKCRFTAFRASCRNSHPWGPIAQWLEQRTHNPLVLGSSPSGPTSSPQAKPNALRTANIPTPASIKTPMP